MRRFVDDKPRAVQIDVVARVTELMGENRTVDRQATVMYSFTMGYERLTVRDPHKGTFNYEGAWHPNGHCEGVSVCVYCGKVL